MSLGAGTPLTLEGIVVYPQGQGSGITYTDIGQHSPLNQTLERKLDQMMEMITNTQQIVVEQQSNQ
jgi:protoheme ferro-lyase